MTRIVLTEEQAKLLNPTEEVQICDPRGHTLVVLPPQLTLEEFAKLRRAKDSTGPRHTGEEVRQALQFLEEAWEREGPFDKMRMHELLDQWRARKP